MRLNTVTEPLQKGNIIDKPDYNLCAALLLLQILKKIPKNRKISAQEITRYLEETGQKRDERSVQRYLAVLCEHFDIECDMSSRPYGYRWKSHARGLDIPILNEQESLMLMLAEQRLVKLLPTNVMNAMQPFFQHARHKLIYDAEGRPEREWLGKVAVVPTSQPLLPPDISDGILEAVSGALFQNRWLDITYRNQNGFEKSYRVMPLGLVQQGSVLYLVARFEGFDDERNLALHRIQTASISLQTFPRPNFNLQAYCDSGRFGFGEGKRIRLTFSISHHAGFHLTETKLANNQCIVEETREHYRFQAELIDSTMLDWWLAKFGDEVWDIEKMYL